MAHEQRVRECTGGFTAAMDELVGMIEKIDADTASRRAPDGGWSVAQIGWHIARTNDVLGGVITGEVPMAVPAPAGYAENATVFSGLPPKVQTFPQLEPPAGVTRDQALADLRASTPKFLAAVQSLTPERATGYCMTLAFGTMSMYQVAEFATKHVQRHQGQIQRTIAGV